MPQFPHPPEIAPGGSPFALTSQEISCDALNASFHQQAMLFVCPPCRGSWPALCPSALPWCSCCGSSLPASFPKHIWTRAGKLPSLLKTCQELRAGVSSKERQRQEGREGQFGVAKAVTSHQDIRARGSLPYLARPFALVAQRSSATAIPGEASWFIHLSPAHPWGML